MQTILFQVGLQYRVSFKFKIHRGTTKIKFDSVVQDKHFLHYQ